MEQGAQIQKGKVSALKGGPDANGNPTTAQILPCTAGGSVTRPLVIPWWLRGEMGALEPGTGVVYVLFEDATGILLARTDGEWPGVIPGSLQLLGSLTAQDIITGAVASLNSHTHGGVEPGGGSTAGPQ